MSPHDEKLELVIESLKKDVEYIKDMLKDLKDYFIRTQEKNEKKFVTHDQFRPVKLIVYGMVSIIMVSVLGSILSNIIQK